MTAISDAFSVSFIPDSCASEKDPAVGLADKVKGKSGITIMKCKSQFECQQERHGMQDLKSSTLRK